jgi:hypothetical protein
MVRSDGSSGVSRGNLGKGYRELLSGLGILEFCAPVGHAHRIEPTEYVGASLIDDKISDLHEPQARVNAAHCIGRLGPSGDPSRER